MDGAPDHLTATPVITTLIQTSEVPKTAPLAEALLPTRQLQILQVVDQTTIVITNS